MKLNCKVMAQPDLKNALHNNGWVLVKNIFSSQEIDSLREKIYETKKKGYKGDILSNPLLQNLVYDDRVVKIVSEALGGQPIYFGDGNFLVNNNQWGFHKDNPDRNDPNAPDWKGEYGVVRIGIYLQDHTASSGGLLLRDKSHNNVSITNGKPFNVPIQKGDVALWYLKTTHSGNARLLKFAPNLIINPKYYRFVPDFLFLSEKAERIGIFITYGKEGSHLERYFKYLKSRQYAVNAWQNSVYDAQVVQEAEKHGIRVVDMRQEVKDIKVESLNKDHADIPY